MADIPDVTNPDIRNMVLRDHEPEETWIGNYAGDSQVFVYCRTCWQGWPCPSHKAAWQAEREACRAAIQQHEERRKREYRSHPWWSRWWWC